MQWCSYKKINLSYWWVIWFFQMSLSAVTDGWASTLLWNLRKALCSSYHDPWPAGTGVRASSSSRLTRKPVRPLYFPLLNEDWEGKWLPWGPGLDFTRDASLAAAKDKVSLEKQSCWEVTPPANYPPIPARPAQPSQAGSGHPWQLL